MTGRSERARVDESELPIRPELRGLSPYGAPQLDVPVLLNTNENPFPPGPDVQRAIIEAVAQQLPDIDRYPDRDAVALRTALAGYLMRTTGVTLEPEQLWAANGSNEVLQQLLQLFGGPDQPALGFSPTYSMHSIIARGTHTPYLDVPRRSDFGIDIPAALAAIAGHDPGVVFICSPNNPTGTCTSLDDIAEIYDGTVACSRAVIVVDEAYAEFSSAPSAVTLLAQRPRLIVTRTMSKAFAFAGGRLGYLAASPHIVRAVQLVRLPYHLSAITQAAAQAALAHESELAAAVTKLAEQRDRIVRTLTDLGCEVVPSEANFVLFSTPTDQSLVWQELLNAGVLVRDVGLAGWLRVTAGTESQTTTFLTALTRIVHEQAETDGRRG